MQVIALTGSVASGKSTVAALFRQWGATIIDADAIVHQLQQPGEEVFAAIVARFGQSVVRSDGALDRPALRAAVLNSVPLRVALEAIVHPAVEARRVALLHDAEQAGVSLAIVDIPLLFESADPSQYDGVIVVDAPVDQRRARLMRDRKLSIAEANAFIGAQLPAEQKRARATWVIVNDGDLAELTKRSETVWEALPH